MTNPQINPMSTTASERVMPTTLRLPRPYLHPQHPISRIVRLSQDLRLSTSVIDKAIYGPNAWNVRYAQVIESDLRAGDHTAVGVWVAPGDAARDASDVLDLATAFREYDAADVAEDAAQVALNGQCLDVMTDADMETHARAVCKELYAGTRYFASIRKTQRDRKAAAR